MPLKRCKSDGKPGWKFGDGGRCYTYTPNDKESALRAKKKAIAQAVAMGAEKEL